MLWLNLLIGAGALQGVFLACVLFGLAHTREHPPLRWLGGFVGAFSLLVLGDVLLQTRAILELPHLYQLFDFLIFCLGPLCYAYVRGMLGLAPWRWYWLLLHFLLGLLLQALILSGLFVGATEKRATILEDLAATPQQSPDVFFLAAGLLALAYLIRSLMLMRAYWRNLESVYSNTDRYMLRWLAQLLGYCGLLWAFWMVSILWGIAWADVVAQCGLAVGVYALGYRGLSQPRLWSVSPRRKREAAALVVDGFATGTSPSAPIASEVPAAVERMRAVSEDLPAPPMAEAATPKYAKSGIGAEALAEIGARLNSIMQSDLLFLEPELSLADLAARIGVSPHALSQTLSVHFGQNFFEYVNALRVEEVKRCFADPAYATQSVLEIALASGFASKATFNATFKRLTGVTPSAIRGQLGADAA
jgi:AraC-like DNA-binding protein